MGINEFLKEIYRLKFGYGFRKSARQMEEVFLFFLFAEYFGMPNYFKFYFAEIIPELLEEFHSWHRRMGMEKSPLEWIRCC